MTAYINMRINSFSLFYLLAIDKKVHHRSNTFIMHAYRTSELSKSAQKLIEKNITF